MSVNVTAYPKKTMPGGQSKWSALHQPIYFEMMRKDITIVSITDDGTGKVKVNTNDDIATVAVDQYVYINCGSYVGSYKVLSCSNVVPRYIVLDCPFVSIAVSGYANLITARPNYYIETRILGVTGGVYTELGTSVNKPDATGLAQVNVATFLKSIVDYKNTFQYNVRNKADVTQGGRFNIQYRECWTGTTGTYSALSATLLYYIVNAAKQIQQANGSNMGEYVTFPLTNTAKFLSDFERPTYFPGLPFSLSFIWSDAITGYALSKEEVALDSQSSVVVASEFDLDNTQNLSVNRLMIEGGYPSNVKTLQVWLNASVGGCTGYVASGYVASGYSVEECGLPEVGPPPPPDDLGTL